MVRRSGYTLLELMLVIVLILAVAAMALPRMESWLASGRLRSEADKVRARLVQVRNLAMAEGRVYTFKFMENTGNFRIEPDDSTESTANDGSMTPTVKEEQLEAKVIFVKQADVLKNASAPGGGGSYETVVTFQPDGSAKDDAQIIIGIPGQGAKAVGVRALTGAVYAIDLNATGGI
ncbi:MAG: prepilin-type N-terminal cleavage/methylation domain-containing protein [Gemmataceae bacterium]